MSSRPSSRPFRSEQGVDGVGAELVINGDFVDILASNSGIWASLMKPQALPEDDVGAMATILQL